MLTQTVGNPLPIRQLRKEKKLSQIELAEKAGISRATLLRIENGQTVPEKRTLKAISVALGIDNDATLQVAPSTESRKNTMASLQHDNATLKAEVQRLNQRVDQLLAMLERALSKRKGVALPGPKPVPFMEQATWAGNILRVGIA